MSGRFAPSPTGDLHVGNLRTALLAWLATHAAGGDLIVRMEDLDRIQAAPEHERSQLADLASLGIDWTSPVVRQSERFDLYRDALATLDTRGLVYECFCSRREVRAEIADAPHAPHLPPGSYPGTCRTLSARRRSQLITEGRTPALRLRAPDPVDDAGNGRHIVIAFDDLVAGPSRGGVDDVVLRRNDGVPAYNLAVVVDDAAQGVTQVVRGNDLLDSTPRQIHLQQLLDLPTPVYGHVPLVFGEDGERLSKRHGSVTLDELRRDGATVAAVVVELVRSAGITLAHTPSDPQDLADLLADLARDFRLGSIPAGPVIHSPAPDRAARFRLRNDM